ncbi:hypothetical protein FHS91_003693 [Sphingobium xanthum]|jgi:hypothetical protein|uniref:hypothetical protein n=1 Tax=Sphingobium xanthum TaxID=1387165 RepID=UPI001C8B4B0B|nr:hypothetical protein [Sphingobium xanthum]
MTAQTSPYLPGPGGMLASAVSLVANVGLSACSDPIPVQAFRVFVTDQSGRCEFRVDGDIVSISNLVRIARLRDGRRVDARIVSPASGVMPKCAELAQRSLEHARFATVTFSSRHQASRSGGVALGPRHFDADSRKD